MANPVTAPEGLLLVDKPSGLTSHDVVNRVRRLAGTRKVGHAGTLDPMATGLLVLGLGRATRLLTYLVGAEKTYTATIRLGQSTDTDDAEGEVTSATNTGVAEDLLEAEMAELTGEIQQVPSTVSAIKVDGQRAYARARAGERVELSARPVTIHEFAMCGIDQAVTNDGTEVTDVDVRVRCSSGTYIRALARDLGARLEAGGHLITLRRTHVGTFDVADALNLEKLGPGSAFTEPGFLPLSRALASTFPIRLASDAETRTLSYGQSIPASVSTDVTGVLGLGGQAVALVENRDGQAHPILVFAPA